MPLSLDTLSTANLYAASKSSSTPTAEELEKEGYTVSDPEDSLGLNFEDFLQLMVAQLQNQTIDNSMDTSEMMNQLVQMSVVQMLNSVQTSLDNLTATNTMTYAASLVGKTVTVGSYDEDGNIQETVGTVTASGTYQDTPVIFVDGEMYPLSSIMAVGTLPEISETPDAGEGGDESTDTSTGDTAAQQSQAV